MFKPSSHIISMTTLSIYAKNQHCSNDDLWSTLAFITARSNMKNANT